MTHYPVTPQKTYMTIENQPTNWRCVCYETWWFSIASHVRFREGSIFYQHFLFGSRAKNDEFPLWVTQTELFETTGPRNPGFVVVEVSAILTSKEEMSFLQRSIGSELLRFSSLQNSWRKKFKDWLSLDFFCLRVVKENNLCVIWLFLGHRFYEPPLNQPSSVPLRDFLSLFSKLCVFLGGGVLPVQNMAHVFVVFVFSGFAPLVCFKWLPGFDQSILHGICWMMVEIAK